MIGETIGNFRIVSALGRGGMGEVWLAEQQSIETKVAIKMLRREISEDANQVRRFFNEARAVGKIHHAGIVKIFDVGFHRGQAYLVMEYLEGETLGGRLRRLGVLSLRRIADVGKQTASVLDATHAAGITHRDLKPDNIFLVPDRELAGGERVKVLDFGVAKLSGTLAINSPRTSGTLGTPAYIAPEQWNNASAVDWRADAYSLGCIAFEMATGRPPFNTTTYAAACHKHLYEPPPPLRELAPTASAELAALIEHLLAKAPADRPASMDAIGRAFAALADGAPADADDIALSGTIDPVVMGHAETVSSTGKRPIRTDAETLGDTGRPPPAQPGPRRRRGGAVIAIAGLAVAGIGVVAAVRGSGSSPTATSIDAAPVVVVTAGIDAPPTPPVDSPPTPTIDAAASPVDAASRRPRPDAEELDYEDLPDEIDEPEVHAMNIRLVKKMTRCGAWTNADNYGADYRIDMTGAVADLVVTGPDEAIKACMAKIIRATKYPMSKHGIGVGMGIER